MRAYAASYAGDALCAGLSCDAWFALRAGGTLSAAPAGKALCSGRTLWTLWALRASGALRSLNASWTDGTRRACGAGRANGTG